jgi:site-specific recombinase XerD
MFLSKSRHGYYYIWHTDDRGKRRNVSTRCKRKSDALKSLRGFDERNRKMPTILLSKFIDEFLQYANSTYARRTVDLYERAFRNLLRHTPDLPLHRITSRHVDDYKAWRASCTKPVTTNMELRAIRAALSTAVRWQLIDTNPCNGVTQIPVPQQAPCYVSPVEVKKLLLEIKEEWLRQVVWFAVLTGMRQGQVRGRCSTRGS